MYEIIYHEDFFRKIKKIDVSSIDKILSRITDYLAIDPVNLGKSLTAECKGLYRYRYGDYRVIYKILLREKQICILGLEHRSEIYKYIGRKQWI